MANTNNQDNKTRIVDFINNAVAPYTNTPQTRKLTFQYAPCRGIFTKCIDRLEQAQTGWVWNFCQSLRR